MKIYFLGGGNMATALIGGLRRQGGGDIHVVGRNPQKQQYLADTYGVATSAVLPPLTADDVLVLAVKPQDMAAATQGLDTGGALVLSVAAGLDIATLSRYLGGAQRIIRIMPNTPGQVGKGMAGLYAPPHISATDKAVAENIMRSNGGVIWLPEEAAIHNIIAICGSGPAYVFYLLNALQQAAQAHGFSATEARRLSLATFEGAVALAAATDADFTQLQHHVTSKGGTTEQALAVLEARAVADAMAAAAAAAARRSQAMEQDFTQAAKRTP